MLCRCHRVKCITNIYKLSLLDYNDYKCIYLYRINTFQMRMKLTTLVQTHLRDLEGRVHNPSWFSRNLRVDPMKKRIGQCLNFKKPRGPPPNGNAVSINPNPGGLLQIWLPNTKLQWQFISHKKIENNFMPILGFCADVFRAACS